ncbi:MAG: pyridoxamine 5'-phosphate oxidase family protein [Nitrososphaerales archaeon]
MSLFTDKELKYIKGNTLCRLATASKDAIPHVTPVLYVFNGNYFYIAIDYGEKKLKNLRENDKVSLVIDDRTKAGARGIMIQGRAEVLERGEEYRYALKLLFDRFEIYRSNPWGEGEAPIIKVLPKKKASWRIN